jgi:hypothetical protein
MSEARARSPFCRCEYPDRAKTRDDVVYCKTCDGLLPDSQDELLAMLTRTAVRMSRQLDALTAANGGDGGASNGQRAQSRAPVTDFPPRSSTDDELISPGELAQRLGRKREWVYDHADELGAKRIGSGPKPRLWFIEAKARRLLEQTEESSAKAAAPTTRTRARLPKTDLLEVRR